jgi:hypothetical protein
MVYDQTDLNLQDISRAEKDLSRFIASSVRAGRASETPFHHIVFERVFPDDIYAAMLLAMPVASDYRPMAGRSKARSLVNRVHTRVKIDLFPEYIRSLPPEKRVLWTTVGRALCSTEVKDAFIERLAVGLAQRFGSDLSKVGLYPIPILTRDIPGYFITPHPDTRWKGITAQFYLPPDETTLHVGTIFHERLQDDSLPVRARMKFSPNTGYAFAVGKETWHSVDPVGPEVETRDSILLTYFVDVGLLHFFRNRGRRVANFLNKEFRAQLAHWSGHRCTLEFLLSCSSF